MNSSLPGLVTRPRLISRLAEAREAPLVLLSGPAGSGKTSLLAQWVAGLAEPVGRVEPDADDSQRLWPALLGALDQLGLALPGGPDHERAAGALLGQDRLRAVAAAVASSPRDLVLLLDGFELRDADLAGEVSYLLDHSWGRLRLVLSARVDPVLPLYRYRLEGRVVELRAADLAFTDAEAGELLRLDGVSLPPGTVRDLNRRLGGWAAGLRFAARALSGRTGDPVPAVAAVVAHDADIAEYLIGEVLSGLDGTTRELMLHTSVPDTLVPGLADELAGQAAGRAAGRALQELAGNNTFLEPVPGHPGSYRYPPFFRDLLRAQLAWEDPDAAERLHRQAAAWLRSHGMPDRSLDQLAAGGLWGDLADQLIAHHGVATLLLGTDRHVTEVAHRIPFRVSDAGACVVRAVIALSGSDAATCAAEVDSARGALRSRRSRPGEPVLAALALVDALRAASAADTTTARSAVQQADRSVAMLAGSPVDRDSEALVELARAAVALRCGELDDARAALAGAAAVPGLPPRLRISVLGYEALTDALEGHLSRARELASHALALAEDAHVAVEGRPSAPEVALALVALERDDRAAARHHIAAARASRTFANDPVSRTIAMGVLGHVDAAAGQVRPAMDRLGADEERAGDHDPWLADWLRLQVAELWVAQGHADLALRELEAITHDELGAAVVAAAAYAEQGRRAAVEESLARARASAQPLPAEVTRLLVQGVHESRQRAPQRALTLVDRALRLAKEEEVRRPFREAAPTVRVLLSGHPQLLGRHRWLSAPPSTEVTPGRPSRERRGAPGGRRTGGLDRAVGPVVDPAVEPAVESVVEPLTARETEVLCHLEELLTTEEIAGRMFVSVNTVRTHVRSILRKLGVNRRNTAVRRARELGLLEHHERPTG